MAFKVNSQITYNPDSIRINWDRPQLLREKGEQLVYLYNPSLEEDIQEELDEYTVVVTLIYHPNDPQEVGRVLFKHITQLEPLKDDLKLNFEYEED